MAVTYVALAVQNSAAAAFAAASASVSAFSLDVTLRLGRLEGGLPTVAGTARQGQEQDAGHGEPDVAGLGAQVCGHGRTLL